MKRTAKKWPRKCSTKFCRGRTWKHYHHSTCPKCTSRAEKERAPLKVAFRKLRFRAKERGHEFTLTFAEYEKFAIETGYDKLKGKHSHSLSIHRKDETKGYHSDNIAAVSLSLNSKLAFSSIPDYLLAEYEDEMKRRREEFANGGGQTQITV
jgi:hypothetical protein